MNDFPPRYAAKAEYNYPYFYTVINKYSVIISVSNLKQKWNQTKYFEPFFPGLANTGAETV